ncbi:MAG TPA: PAS domain S-box protein, partial [Cellvibrio sp.]|nr:PAS domain S-box protein [Cellvibrio sp.]
YERNELLGKPIEQLIPHNAAKSHSHNRDSFFANPSPRAMGAGRELFGLRRDGEEFPLEIGLAPVSTKDGLKVLASIVDITERRNASIALNESRERLELTTRINQIGVWEYDVDDGKLIWNDAMFDIYGRNKDYFTHDYNAWKKCVHSNDIDNVEKAFQEAIANLSPYFCKFRIIQPDGTIKYIHAKAKIERLARTNKLRVLGTNIDITREELAIAKLHNLEALRSAIVESSEDAIISKTPTGIITSWNVGACNMFGYSAEEAIGRPIKDLVFPENLKDQEDMLLAQVRAGTVIKHFETVRRCKDGPLINVSLTLSPIKDSLGNIVGVSAIKRDITAAIETAKQLTARKKELEQSNQELERSNRELETFAYVASHDLKSPLRGIAQLSTWIEEDLAANEHESVKGHTELLRNRIKRMEKLLDDLLIFYRAGKMDGELIAINLTQMISAIFEIQNNKPGLRLEIIGDQPNLTTLSTPLELVIRNLFSNAIKHHDKQEGIIRASARELNNG